MCSQWLEQFHTVSLFVKTEYAVLYVFKLVVTAKMATQNYNTEPRSRTRSISFSNSMSPLLMTLSFSADWQTGWMLGPFAGPRLVMFDQSA